MRVFVILLLSLITITVHGQRSCATTTYVQQQVQATPGLAAAYQQVEQHIQRVLSPVGESPLRDTLPNEVITIPVVVHVLYNTAAQNISDAQVKSQIDVLNNDYRMLNADTDLVPAVFKGLRQDARIQFCLAQVDPQDRRTTGIIHTYTTNPYFLADDGMKYKAKGGADAWNTKKYLNIWVCNIFGRILGYGTPPGGTPEKDGVVIMYDVFGTIGNLRAPFTKGRTTTHEVGHWLGLKHLWGDDACGDDGVDDTPRQKSYNYGCPVFPRKTDCSLNNNGDLFMNFMDYTDDACMSLFTNGQKRRMRALFANGGPRNSFLVNYACDSTQAQGGPLPDPGNVPVEVTAVQLYPNPVTDVLVITSKDATLVEGKTLQLFNQQGILLQQQVLTQRINRIKLTHLLPGVYLLRLRGEQKVSTHKVIKQ